MKFQPLYLVVLCFACSPSVWANPRVKAPYVGVSLDGMPCDGVAQGYGPFDYSKRHTLNPYDLEIVERVHFTPKVENLLGGETSGTPQADLDYTLRAWPNHHRALMSSIRYQLLIHAKLRKEGPDAVPAECHLQRAIRFSPEDPIPHALYGYYLNKLDKPELAAARYQKALELDPGNSKLAYAYAFLLIDLKRYDEALKFAKIAYQHPNAPPALREKLKQQGTWN